MSDTLNDETLIQRSTDRDGYFEEIIPPFPSLYKEQKTYYPTGKIKGYLKKCFIGTLWNGSGIFEQYNEQGELVKIVDDNQQYEKFKVKLEDLIKILQEKNIIDPNKYEDIKHLSMQIKSGIWYITRHIPISEARIYIEVDAQSGKILSEKKEVFFQE